MRARSMRIADLAVLDVATIPSGTSLLDCAKNMRQRHVGSLVVINDNHHPIGMLTDRDITIEAVALEKDIKALKADDIMAAPVITASKNDGVIDALAKMREQGIRRLPVVNEDGTLFGIVTAANIVEEISVLLDSVVRSVKSSKTREIAERP
ncbi:MAG: CBS domain-containing protein [Burkholderiales bacterium]|nr:CBS domain-containing protein [Burkholderiales bacterium]